MKFKIHYPSNKIFKYGAYPSYKIRDIYAKSGHIKDINNWYNLILISDNIFSREI